MSIKDNLENIMKRIEEAANTVGRDSTEIRLMAVSKTKPFGVIQEAIDSGQILFGENRVQEIEQKWSDKKSSLELHMIGHLQSNKVAKAVKYSDCIESIDKLKRAKLVDKYAKELDKVMPIYLEVNTSGEDSKSGYTSELELLKDLELIGKLDNVSVSGLMTIGPLGGTEYENRNAFASLYKLKEKILTEFPHFPCSELSMGMSNDFEWAIMEGSTIVRVGSSIFGQR